MLRKLSQDSFEKLRGIFTDLVQLKSAVDGIFNGSYYGAAFVDDTQNPQSAALYWDQLLVLAGNPNNTGFNRALNTLIANQTFVDPTHQTVPDGFITLCDPAWIDQFPVIFPDRAPVEEPRSHHVMKALTLDWRSQLPEGYVIRRIDQTLLESNLLNVDELQDRIQSAWAEAVDDYSQRGIGACVLVDEEIAGWSFTRVVVGNRCELTLETLPEFSGRGVATLASAAAVDFCQQAGFSFIDEHIAAWNMPSLRVAEKVGFIREREYAIYAYFFDPAVHYSVAGEIDLKLKRYAEALNWYERAFAIGEAPLPAYFNAAIIATRDQKDYDAAFRYLNLAIDRGRGLIPVTMLEGISAFEALHGHPQWQALLARL